MNVFNPVRSEEKKLMREHAKKCKQYKTATPIFYGYLIIVPLVTFVWWGYISKLDGTSYWSGFSIVLGILILIWFIPVVILRCWQICGGRDIFLARLKQQIVFNEDYLSNAWVPAIKEIEPAKYVEYRIAYEDVKKIDYNTEWKRLEIYGKRIAIKDMGFEVKQLEEDGTIPYVIYNYFENMEQLKQELCTHTGLEIKQI